MLKLRQVHDLLSARIPEGESWTLGERYGLQSGELDRPVRKVLYCVTPSQAITRLAVTQRYDLVISHHPFDLPLAHNANSDPDLAVRPQEQPAHMIFHTALDCCAGGLNDMWRDFLEVKDARHFDRNLGWYGRIEPIEFSQLVDKISRFSGVAGAALSSIPTINSVVICSGLGGLVLSQAARTKMDCYILGELACEAAEVLTRGLGAVIEVGHTKSERIGVRFFQDLLSPLGIQVDCAPEEIDVFGREIYQSRALQKPSGRVRVGS